VTITEQDWQQLEADRHTHGSTVRRVYPQSRHEIFIAVRYPDGSRMLTLGVATRAAGDVLRRVNALPRTRGLELQLASLGEDRGELRVVLTDPGLSEVFNPLVSDIAATAQAQPGPAEAVLAALERFEHWRRLLQSLADTGLSPEARRGLFGELSMLRDHLLPVMPATDAVRAWTGPMAAHQDFQLPGAAIEVKTSAGKEPQTLVISSERELDGTAAGQLILAHLSLDERRGGNGESLKAAVDRTRAAVTGAAARTLLDDLLVRAGYLAHQRDLYDEPRYSVRQEHFWHVDGDFPRITEADLRPGVGDCRYRISTDALEQYGMTTEQVAAAITGESADE
jgi:hypothetical protein